MNCNKDLCAKGAVTALQVEFYPPKAVMRHYGTDKPLSRMIVNLCLCDAHADEVIKAGPGAIFPPKHLEVLAKPIIVGSGTQVDHTATKLARCALDDPDYLKLMSMRSKQ